MIVAIIHCIYGCTILLKICPLIEFKITLTYIKILFMKEIEEDKTVVDFEKTGVQNFSCR